MRRDKGLYWPFWSIDDPEFLLGSLLYWDTLACIVPSKGFRAPIDIEDRRMRAAMERVHEELIISYVPDANLKGRTYERLSGLAWHRLPESYKTTQENAQRLATLDVEKFGEKAVELISSKGFLKSGERHGREVGLGSPEIVNLLVGIMVDEYAKLPKSLCAPITNQPASFAETCKTLAAELEPNRDQEPARETDEVERRRHECADFSLLMARVPVLGCTPGAATPEALDQLRRLRRNMEWEDRRRDFKQRVEGKLGELGEAQGADRQVLRQEWEMDVRDDLKSLEEDLHKLDLLWVTTKENLVLFMGSVGVATAPIALGLPFVPQILAAATGLLAVAKGLLEREKARKEALDRHWTSWLYEVHR